MAPVGDRGRSPSLMALGLRGGAVVCRYDLEAGAMLLHSRVQADKPWSTAARQ